MSAPAIGRFPLTACKFCGDQIAVNSLARHEKGCETATPEQRRGRVKARLQGRLRYDQPPPPHHLDPPKPVSRSKTYQREYQRQYAQRRKANNGRPLKELVAATAHARAILNGKPEDLVELTIALPRSVVMEMLIQGLPHATIVSIGGWRLEQ